MRTTFVVYRSEKRVFITTKESEEEFLGEVKGWKVKLEEDYDRTVFSDSCVSVGATLNCS